MKNNAAKTFQGAVNSQRLIHCITNPISINLLANGILALGCRPIMAEHYKEVYEITSSADALLLNCGNITDSRIKSIKISAKAAVKNKIPIVFDAVGTSCSNLRREFALKIIDRFQPQILKGNASEIYALYRKNYKCSGVDRDINLKMNDIKAAAKYLAEKYKCVVVASGQTDIIADSDKCVAVKNGTQKLSDITGTGCLLGAVAAIMLTGGEAFYAAIAACGVIGIAAEFISQDVLSGSFGIKLIDEINSMDTAKLLQYLKLEEMQ